MATTTFYPGQTPIIADWLNDVDASTYQGQLDDGSTNASIDQYLPAGTGAVTTTVQAKLRESVSVKDFGATGDGVTDDTVAIQAAIDAYTSGQISIYFPSGTYKVTNTITIAQDRTNLFGDGQQATVIQFSPTTTSKTAFHFEKAASGILVQVSLRGMAFRSSGNTQDTKSAMQFVDCDGVIVDDIAVSSWTSTSEDCIGMQFKGRQLHSISNVSVYADKPISIEDNPNDTIDIDHYHFFNCILSSQNEVHPIVTIASGVNLTNVTFDGYQSWTHGSNGLKWVDTTSVAASQQLVVKNLRWEQSTTAAGYMFDIEHNYGLQQLRLENCAGGLSTLGIKLRNVTNATIANTMILNTSGNALDVDSTVQPLMLDNVFTQAGSTVSVGTLKKVFDSGRGTNGGTSGAYVIYTLPASIVPVIMDFPLMGTSQTIATDGTITLGVAARMMGFLFVSTQDDVGAIYYLKGGTNGTVEVSDPDSLFTPTKNSASSYNIYYETDNYILQSKRSTSKDVAFFFIGTSI